MRSIIDAVCPYCEQANIPVGRGADNQWPQHCVYCKQVMEVTIAKDESDGVYYFYTKKYKRAE